MKKLNKIIFRVFASILIGTFVVSFSGVALADPITDPTHFDDTYWYWQSNPNGFTEMDTGITPLIDGSPDGYYFSTGFWFTGDPGGYGGYMGLQTEGAIPTGKIAIFSIWGATASSGGDYNGSGTEVGATYYTSRISYPWVVNDTYGLRIVLSSQSSGSETWTAIVTDQSSGVSSLIGNIVTPSSMGNLQAASYTFHERYSGPTASCSGMQESEVKFTDLSAENGTRTPISHTNDAPTGSACAGDFATENLSNGVETIIGGQFPVAPAPTPTPSPTPKPTPTSTAPSSQPTDTQTTTSTAPATTTQPTPTPASSTTTTKQATAKETASTVTPLEFAKPKKTKVINGLTIAAYSAGIGLGGIVAALVVWALLWHRIVRKRIAKNLANKFPDYDLNHHKAIQAGVVGDFTDVNNQVSDHTHQVEEHTDR